MNYFSIFLFFLSFYFVYSSGDWNAEDFAEIMKQSQEAENNKHASLLNPTTSYHGGMGKYELNNGRYDGSNLEVTNNFAKHFAPKSKPGSSKSVKETEKKERKSAFTRWTRGGN
uniref:Uncharacterized protein n=1 Tax=Meloidogyne floridensis TaxID=298350 RepID=A0A915NUK4_9BILA